MRQAVEAVKNKGGNISGAVATFGINPTSVANRVAGREAVAARHGPQTVHTVKEETSSKTWASLGISCVEVSANRSKTAVPRLGIPRRGLAKPGSPHVCGGIQG